MDPRKQAYLDAMGIRVWVRRHAACQPDLSMPGAIENSASLPESGARPESPDWEGLAAQVAACKRCPDLVANRTQTVFGVGDYKAELMVIGEAPGADEDRQGEPFVGRAGKLLDSVLRAAGFPRPTVYIANILKCRPPNNRDPEPDEAIACAGYLRRQIELVGPKAILVVGRVAAQNLLETKQPTGRLRGDVHSYADTHIPVIVTYHPAYLLRSPAKKREVWKDLRLIKRVCGGATG